MPKLFQELPLGTVFTHRLPGRRLEWWKKVEGGSRRCNPDGSFVKDDMMRFGIAVTQPNTPCFVRDEEG
jgi:hypothetical protein